MSKIDNLSIKNNQKKFNIFVEFVNTSIKDKTFKYKININSFESFIKNFYEQNFYKKLKSVTEEELSFERVFKDKRDILMDIKHKIILSVMLLQEINKTSYRNLIYDRCLRLHFDFNEEWYSIAMPHSKRLCKNNISLNIFYWIFQYFKAEIEKYVQLSDKDKLIKICKKYSIKVDFTKRKHSYAYSSNHIVFSESVNFKAILLFFEKENTIYTEGVLRYFVYFVINKQ